MRSIYKNKKLDYVRYPVNDFGEEYVYERDLFEAQKLLGEMLNRKN